MPIKVRVGQTEAVKILSSKGGGSVSTQDAVNVIGGIASVSQLSVSGVSTFTGIGTFVDDLYVGDRLYAGNTLNVTNDINIGNILYVPQAGGIDNQGFTNLYGNVSINDGSSGIFNCYKEAEFSGSTEISGNLNATGITTISNLYGDASNLTGVTVAGIDTAGVSKFNRITTSGVSTFVGVSTFNNHVNIAPDKSLSIGDMAIDYSSFANSAFITIPSGKQIVQQATGITLQGANGEKYFKAASTNTRLFHNGSERLRTTTNGIQVSNGIVTGTSDAIPGTLSALDGIFTGNVSVAGTLTYEDVTNIDSVGIVTARKDVHVGAGLSVVGLSTFGDDAQFMDMVRLGRPHSAEYNYTPGKFFIFNGKESPLDAHITFQDHLYIHGPIQVKIGPVGEYLKIYNYNGRGQIQFGDNASTKSGLDMYGKGSVSMRVDAREGVGIGSTVADVTLGYDGNPKFQTSGVGATVYGQLDTTDLNVNGTLTAGIIDGGSF